MATIKHRLDPFSKTLVRYFSTVLCLLVNAVSIHAAQVRCKRKKFMAIPLSIVEHQLTFNNLASIYMGRERKEKYN